MAAARCGLGHRKGRSAPGYDVDLLAVAYGVGDYDLRWAVRRQSHLAQWNPGAVAPIGW